MKMTFKIKGKEGKESLGLGYVLSNSGLYRIMSEDDRPTENTIIISLVEEGKAVCILDDELMILIPEMWKEIRFVATKETVTIAIEGSK